MNTTVAVVGPYCSGKSLFLEFLQRKFTGQSGADLVFSEVPKQDRKRLIRARNVALEDSSLMFEFLTQSIQSAAKAASNSFRNLEARQFLFLEQAPEYWDVIVTAARNVNLITLDQWRLLRTLLDELVATFIVDIFVLTSHEDQEKCNNFHRRSGRSEHREGAALQKLNVEIDNLHLAWVHKQRARGKVVIDLSPRISKFARGVRAKKILNIVFLYSNKTNGTAFPLFVTAAAARAAAAAAAAERAAVLEVETSNLGPRVEVRNSECYLHSNMPPKKSSQPKPGTLIEGMDAARLREETEAFQMRVQRLIQVQGRGAPRSTSAGVPMMPASIRPSGPSAGRSMVLPRGRQMVRGRGVRQPLMPNVPRMPTPSQFRDRAAERAALEERLAQLDREEGRGQGNPGLLPRRGASTPTLRQRNVGYLEPREVGMREEEPLFRRTDQKKLSDSSYKEKMERAANRLIASGFGGGYGEEGRAMFREGLSTLRKDDLSDKEDVSSDSTNDDSEEEERKRKVRRRNAQKDAKRRKREKEEEEFDSDPYSYTPLGYQGEESVPGPSVGLGMATQSFNFGNWQGDGYQEDPTLGEWSGVMEEEDYGQYEDADQSQAGGASSFQENYQGGEGNEDEWREDYDQEAGAETAFPPQQDFINIDVKEETEKSEVVTGEEEGTEQGGKIQAGQGSGDESGTTKKGRVASSSSTKGKQPLVKKPPGPKSSKPKVSWEVNPEKDTFVPPADVAKRIPKKKLVKVSPEVVLKTPEVAEKRKLITQEEMAAAIANIKQEKVTPPKEMTNTMCSNELKRYLVSRLNSELEMEMNVPGSKHFPKILNQPAGELSSMLPQIRAQVFETPSPGHEVEPEKSKRPLPPAQEAVDRSTISISQSEFDELEELEEVEEEENADMIRILQESKRTAILDEERRQAAWAALGQTPPGSSQPSEQSPGRIPKKTVPALVKDAVWESPAKEDKEAKVEKKSEQRSASTGKIQKDASSGKMQSSSASASEVRKVKSVGKTAKKAEEGKPKKVEKGASGKTSVKKKQPSPEKKEEGKK